MTARTTPLRRILTPQRLFIYLDRLVIGTFAFAIAALGYGDTSAASHAAWACLAFVAGAAYLDIHGEYVRRRVTR